MAPMLLRLPRLLSVPAPPKPPPRPPVLPFAKPRLPKVSEVLGIVGSEVEGELRGLLPVATPRAAASISDRAPSEVSSVVDTSGRPWEDVLSFPSSSLPKYAVKASNMASSLRSSPMHSTKSTSPNNCVTLASTLVHATPLLTPRSFTSTCPFPFTISTSNPNRRSLRFVDNSFACQLPKCWSASRYCHTRALPLLSMKLPCVRFTYCRMISKA
mmetsp:Transcript_138412/g.442322  ORF Transcript_138412/g.442322 Transcript_138412/m.442322 type:complete len:214 (+) Transcript_138412:434-1075(+)